MNGYIYLTRNSINNKVYIGQSRNPANWYYGRSRVLRKVFRKYGKDKFTRIKLVENIASQTLLDILEKEFIKTYKATDPRYGYNISKGGKHSIDTVRTTPWCRNISNSLKGKKLRESTKEKISKAKMGKKVFCKTNYIEIYNKEGVLMHTVDGYFKEYCAEHKLPCAVLTKSYLSGGVPIYKNLTPQRRGVVKNNGNLKYEGWYAVKIKRIKND